MLVVLALGAGAAETGGLAAAQSLPFLLLALPAGVLTDRLPRRALLVGAEALRAVAMLAANTRLELARSLAFASGPGSPVRGLAALPG